MTDLPSPWVVRFAPLIEPGGPVLDVACGGGRHTRLFLDRGHPVTAVDRDVSGLGATGEAAEVLEADLEDGSPFPLAGRAFAGVVVTRYLHRPLFPALLAALRRPGGVLIYETFAAGQERHGRPTCPDFLLQPGELLEVAAAAGLRVVAYEDLTVEEPVPAVIQRICARREP